MLNKKIFGRLGNQMFQYAAVRAYQEKYAKQEKINLDFSDTFQYLERGNRLELLNFNIQECKFSKVKTTLPQKIILKYLYIRKIGCFIMSKINPKKNFDQRYYEFEKKHQKKLNKHGIYSMNHGYADISPSNKKNKIFIGSFESPKYFEEIREILLEEFTPKYGVIKDNEEFLKDIKETESVCVSIRRGDFVEDPKARNRFYVCKPEYFKDAIKEMQKRVKKPTFFIFSDDVEWCKNNLDFLPKGTRFEPLTNPVYEKLRLMYNCKHFIISNSTFSWWAQFLSRNDKKVVIAPKVWKKNTYYSDCFGGNMDIYQEGWILIDNMTEKNIQKM